MADVRLSIANREYIVTCNDGEEERLQTLGAMVDDMARQAGGPSGGLNESRLLLFSALLLADKLHDLKTDRRRGQPPAMLTPMRPPKRSKNLPPDWKLLPTGLRTNRIEPI